MAEGIKITQLEEVETLQGDCCFPVVNEGVNKRITKSTLFENEIKGFILETFYPVGHIYLTLGNENPGTLFGGTWEKSNMKAGGDNVSWQKSAASVTTVVNAWKRTN